MNSQYFYENPKAMPPQSSIPQPFFAAQNFYSHEYTPSKSKSSKNQHPPKPPSYDCPICSEQFSSKPELQDHKRDFHKTKFTCEECSKEFTSKLNLITHIDKIHNNIRIKFPCHMCTKEFGSEQYLLTHVTTAHNKKFKCHLCCNEYISEKFLMLHVNRDHIKSEGKKFPCPTCLNEYATKKHLKIHMKEHELLFQCSYCLKPYASKKLILKHIASCHSSQSDVKPRTSEHKMRTYKCYKCSQDFLSIQYLQQHLKKCDTQSFPSDFKEIFQCSVCFERFTSKLAIRQHMDEFHDTDTQQNNSRGPVHKRNKGQHEDSTKNNGRSSSNPSKSKEISNRKPYECEICYKTFGYMASYKYHMESHEESGDSKLNEKKFECSYCDRTFSKTHCLRDHIRTFHEGKMYKCEVCSKTFGYNSNYKRHLKSHTKKETDDSEASKAKEYNFECSECAQTFSQKRYLTDHIRHIHEGRKYECEICSHSFGHIANYKRHLKSHAEPQDKPSGPKVKRYLECPHCNKTFLQVHSLRDHIRTIHEGKLYECETCSKTFGYSSNYKRHLKSHEENYYERAKAAGPKVKRILECPQCDKTFLQVHCLRDHVRTKHEGKLYECEVCSKTFGYLDNYRKHLRAHGEISICMV